MWRFGGRVRHYCVFPLSLFVYQYLAGIYSTFYFICFPVRYGAYSPDEIYSYEDIKHLLRYALVRGVRIVIEIDSPAHAGNGWQWGKAFGYGDLALCVDKAPWRKYCVQPPCGQLNPINPNTYKWLGKIYKDLIDILPQGEAFHMGGDEVTKKNTV